MVAPFASIRFIRGPIPVPPIRHLLQQQDADPRERWRHLQELLKAVGRLRRDDHQAARLLLDQERWEREALRLDQENWERAQKEVQRRATAPLLEALRAARWPQCSVPGSPAASPRRCDPNPPLPANPIKPNQTQSNWIKPDQTPTAARAASPQAPPTASEGNQTHVD